MRWGIIEIKRMGDMSGRWKDFSDGSHRECGDDRWIQFVLYHEVSDQEWEQFRTAGAVRLAKSNPRR
jgi:hypothetical protein